MFSMRDIVLITDFGFSEFVGIVKGVIRSINPKTTIIDLTHTIEDYNILQGAFVLRSAYKYFRKNTIFMCVVDPGVGSERREIILKASDYYFVGPENGIFDLIIQDFDKFDCYVIKKNSKYTLKYISSTFHGRDIFAPVSAYLSKGIPPEKIGEKTQYKTFLTVPKVRNFGDIIEGEIIFFDKFGNGITNIHRENIQRLTKPEVIFRENTIKVCRNFSEGDDTKPNAIIGSTEYLEIFVYKNDLRKISSAKVGEKIIVRNASE